MHSVFYDTMTGNGEKENFGIGICAMCQQTKKFVDAHIIPRAFFEFMRPPKLKSEPFRVLTNRKGEQNSISRTGIYDNRLLCLDCEKRFHKYDDYGQMVLLRGVSSGTSRDKKGKVLGYQVDGVDYKTLKIFFLSVLWRASKSLRVPRLNLGDQYNTALRNIIMTENPSTEPFDCVLARHDDWLGQGYFLDPVSQIHFKGSPINFAMVYLGAGYKLYVKVDKRPLEVDDEIASLVFRDGGPLYIIWVRDFLESKEFDVLRKMI